MANITSRSYMAKWMKKYWSQKISGCQRIYDNTRVK